MHKIQWRMAELKVEINHCLEKAAEAEKAMRLTTAYSWLSAAMEAERKPEAYRGGLPPGMWV
jgi:hypothetical protein